ncbi:MAG: patatin-like phospholipase family protein, partial [Acidobacteriota bacterium]
MDSGAQRRGKTKERKAWGLVLMGGGARGFAHIGVLAVLEENGLVPDIITGTSMGAIVGGLYAAGLPPARLKEIACGLGLNDYIEKSAASRLFKSPRGLFQYLMFADTKNRLLNKGGAGKEDAIEAFLRKLTGDVRIESLPIKFVCNAVDLVSGDNVLFDRGKLYRALRATMTVPVLFAAARREGMVLVDGGVLNNAPVEAAVKLGAAVTVLVDVHRPLRRIPPGRIRT